jgi:DNA-binding PadR family transcriptional regulator
MRSFLHGAVQLHVLHHAAKHPIHGAWMATELARHGYRISPGTLYPTLHRLEAAGLLAGHDDLEAGRRIRRYTITDAGRTALPRRAAPCANSRTSSSRDPLRSDPLRQRRQG